MVCGFFLVSPKWGTLGGFLGSACANIPFLIWLESISSTGADMLSIILAAMILSAIGAVGGLIGGMIGVKSRNRGQS
jgi:ABC-type polysaccharide/polyol phosphate export permease